MRGEQQEMNASRGRPPASGERAALAGYVPQYEVAAGLLLRSLTEESLEWLAVLDPEAGRLDDFQLATPGYLDAFQVKWSQAGGQLAWGELRAYLVDLVVDRRRLARQHTDRRVIGHLYSDRVASSSRTVSASSWRRDATIADAVMHLLQPATTGAFASLEEMPDAWGWLWRDLAGRCGLSERELLGDFALVRIELGRTLPSLAEVPGRDAVSYRRDLDELLLALLRVATDPRQLVRLSKDELLDRLGEAWRQRLELRSAHEFPPPAAYQPVHATAEGLAASLQRFTSGYLTLERSGLPRGPAPVDFDVAALTARLSRQLQQLGDRYQREGHRSIILVDGLDHVERERDVEQPLLPYLPRPEELPDGVLVVVGSQTVRMLHPDIRSQLEQPGRTIQMAPLGRSEVADLALAWRVRADADRLWEVSGGHPLLLTYLLQELRELPAEQQATRLAATPSYGDDVHRLYLRLWTAVEDDEELVELLVHLAGAEEHAAVLATATPAFFRAQLLALRPRELVAADIRLAARSLAVVQDPIALVRLVIAAGELSQRDYHQPDRERFLSLLVHAGQWRLAVEHMEVERESFGAEDSRTARLRISLLLPDSGLQEEARRVFEANEPLEILGGRAARRQPRGPYQLLYAWARAAAVIRSPQAVIMAAEQLRLPHDREVSGRDPEDPTPVARAWMVAAAADELDSRGQVADADRLLAALNPGQQPDRAPCVWALSQRWTRHAGRAADIAGLATDHLAAQDLDAVGRVAVAEGLWKAGSRDAAATWIEGLPQPPLSGASDLSRLWQAQQLRYRLNRLLASLGQRPDPETVVPAPTGEWGWGHVRVARVTVAVAQLRGRAWAGETLAAGEFMAAVRQVLRVFDIGNTDESSSYELRNIRPYALAQLLRVGQLHGREATQALWQEYERRWQDRPGLLRHEGHEVLPAALETGIIPRGVIVQRVRDLEGLVQSSAQDAQAPDDLTKLAGTMVAVGLVDDARRLLWQAVSATLVIYYRKDYQLSDWIGLLGPRLDGESGAQLVRWLAGAIASLSEQLAVGQAHDAAERLLGIDSARRPGHAWQVGAWLRDHGVVGWDDPLAALLNAQVDQAGEPLWWAVLVDQLVPIAPNASVDLFSASRRAVDRHGVAWLRQWLQTLLGRVDVEAPPWTREAWRVTIVDCAVKHHITLAELGLPDELHPERRPLRSQMRGN